MAAARKSAADYRLTTASDHADLFRRLNWGGIEIERAWLEYAFDPRLVVRVGQFLTPYGIWNVDHGTPTLVAVRRPYTIGNALFPERQTGIQVHGITPIGNTDLYYALTLSNGRGPIDAYLDLDDNKAIGGRIALTNFDWADISFGISGYYGSFTRLNRNLTIEDDPIFVANRTIDNQYNELSLAADFRLKIDGLLIQWEGIANSRRYTDEGRPRAPLSAEDVLLPDQWIWGTYLLFGIETPWWGIMPYLIVERTRNESTVLGLNGANAIYVGINWRAHPRVTIKGQGTFIYFYGPSEFGRSQIRSFDAQVAWAF